MVKKVIITGACNGIGLALAKQFILNGDEVISLDISEPSEQLENYTFIKTDITNTQELVSALNQIGNFDLLINNAGVMKRGTLLESTEHDYDFIMDVNVKAAWNLTKLALPNLSKEGQIVFISSRHGTHPKINPGLYSLSKIAVIELAKLFDKSIDQKVRIVCPGPTQTNIEHPYANTLSDEERSRLIMSPDKLAKEIVDFLKLENTFLEYDEDSNSYISRA